VALVRGRGPARTLALAAALAVLAAGCARKMPPPGGRLDREPPRVLATVPESAAVEVPRTTVFEVGFSESMRWGEAERWFVTGPYVPARKISGRDRVLRYEPAESLRAGQAYTLIVGAGATDDRGNLVAGPRAIPFTTGAALPPGRIRGRIEARGHRPVGVFVWAYREDLGHAPDSTARDFDALGVGDGAGEYDLVGLPVPSRWRLVAFHDANRTLSFEPGVDHLTALDSTVALTDSAAVAEDVGLLSLDPAAPATVTGTVADTLAPSGAALRVLAEQIEILTGKPVTAGGQPAVGSVAVQDGGFNLSLPAGRYLLRCYLDLNRNARFDAGTEPVSEPLDIKVRPGDQVTGLSLVAPPGPAPPPKEP
jgi:hypothetical protein